MKEKIEKSFIMKGADMVNPFTIIFGRKPEQMIERFPQRHEILDCFTSQSVNQQIYVLTGVRGSGKTVLLASIEEELRNRKEWMVIELNSELDLLEDLAAQLSSDPICAEWFQKAKINLSFFGFGAEISGEPPISSLQTAVIRMLETIQRKKKRLLITIDEVTNTKQMRIFATAFQIWIRRDLPVYLLMTGLYENIYELQNEKSLTFLYRAPKIGLSSLELPMIKLRYQAVFNCSDEDAVEMSKLTNGYPFAFQLLGYYTWNHQGNFRKSLPEYKQALYEFVYHKIWSELSPKDRLVLKAMASTDNHSVKSIKETLQFSANEWSPYRQRLVRKGIVDASERGMLRFALPLFDEFIRDQMEFE